MVFGRIRGRYLTSRRIREQERLQDAQQRQQEQEDLLQNRQPFYRDPDDDVQQQQQEHQHPRRDSEAAARPKSRLPLIGSWLKPKGTSTPVPEDKDDGEGNRLCFMPNPKITFLVDEPKNLVCQICRQTTFEFLPESDPKAFKDEPAAASFDADDISRHKSNVRPKTNYSDRVPAIMPCGHVAGSDCLKTWFDLGHDTCPFCRENLVHKRCGHGVSLQNITQNSVHLIPATLSAGGEIPDLCTECGEKELKMSAKARLQDCKSRLLEARERYLESGGTEEAGREVEEREAELERVMIDQFYVKALENWLTNW